MTHERIVADLDREGKRATRKLILSYRAFHRTPLVHMKKTQTITLHTLLLGSKMR